MSTVLRISGPYKQLQHSIQTVPIDFKESVASRKERERGNSSYDGTSTYNFTISDADGDQIPVQIMESEIFLVDNSKTINKLRELAGVECLVVDFSWDFPRTSIGQYNRFPLSFLERCAKQGIEIEISVYGISGNSDL